MGNTFEKEFSFYFDIPTEAIFKLVSVDLQEIADMDEMLASAERKLRLNSSQFPLLERKFALQRALFSHDLSNLNLLLNPIQTYDKKERNYLSELNLETGFPLDEHPRRHLIKASVKLSYFPVSEEMSLRLQEKARSWEKKFFSLLRSQSEFLNEIGMKRSIINARKAHPFLKEFFDLMSEYIRFLCENWKLEEEAPEPESFPAVRFSIQSHKQK